MKKTLFIILISVVMPVLTWAQMPSDALFQKYNNKEGISITALAGAFLKPYADNIIASLSTSEKEIAEKCIKSITSVVVARTSGQDTQVKKDLLNDMVNALKKAEYQELIAFNQNNISIKVKTFKEGDTYKEVLTYVNVNNNNDVVLVSVQGLFSEAMINEVMAFAQQNMF